MTGAVVAGAVGGSGNPVQHPFLPDLNRLDVPLRAVVEPQTDPPEHVDFRKSIDGLK